MRKFICGIAAVTLAAGSVRAEDQMITIGSGNTVGIYYAASSAVAKIFNRHRDEYKQWMVTVASQGSMANINNVLEGKVDFGLAQSGLLRDAVRGDDAWEGAPQDQLRMVLRLHVEKLTVVTAAQEEVHNLSDLKGKRINIGSAGSSDASYAHYLLSLAGIDPADVKIVEKPMAQSSDLLEDGKIDAYFYTVGHPVFSVKEASAGKREVRLASLDPSVIEDIVASNDFVSAVSISTDFYEGLVNTQAVKTVGAPAMLFTHKDMPEETVYRMVKEVMTNIDLFRRQHPAFPALKKSEMIDCLSLPMHPGAVRYFKEAGLTHE